MGCLVCSQSRPQDRLTGILGFRFVEAIAFSRTDGGGSVSDLLNVSGLSSSLRPFQYGKHVIECPHFGYDWHAIAKSDALVFAMIGLFSLMSYTVARRTREIGIRISLGAQRRGVLLSVMRETLSLVATGALVGVAFAFALSPVLESQLIGLTPHDPGTIGHVIMLTFAVGAAAGYLPAQRAAGVDPMIALRHE